MDSQKGVFINECTELFRQCSGNRITIPGLGELMIYDEPIIGFASVTDELFERYKQPEVIGSMFWSPTEWLPGAKTVISIFFPSSEAVRSSNREDRNVPSTGWVYARYEGQQFIDAFMRTLAGRLSEQGIKVCIPSLDERLGMQYETVENVNGQDFHVNNRWSERHAAYACGLGTFGLSRGLITRRGIAGRFSSLIIDVAFEPDERTYSGVYDNCIRCGACVRNCPAGAISLERGKNNVLCSEYQNKFKEQFAPRYGCGKCQVGVPCEYRAPGTLSR